MNISGTFYSIRRGGIIAATAATFMLAGCGGGSDGGSATAPATDTPPPAGTANAAPTISGTAVTQVNVGAAYTMTPTAADADGDTLAFSVENLPAWATFSTATGQLTGTPTAVGTFANVAVSVSDGNASARMPAFSMTVASAGSPAPTDPPVVSPPSTGTPIVSKGAATLQWTIPTETVDKSALQDLAGYRVHYGKSGSALTNAVEVPNPSVSTFVVDNLPPGTWYFAIRAVNSAGGPSALSNVLKIEIT
jgi:hypothetical protein